MGNRIRLGLTKEEAARRVGLSISRYLEFERGLNQKATLEEYEVIINKLKTAEKIIPIQLNKTAEKSHPYNIYRVSNMQEYRFNIDSEINLEWYMSYDENELQRLFNKKSPIHTREYVVTHLIC